MLLNFGIRVDQSGRTGGGGGVGARGGVVEASGRRAGGSEVGAGVCAARVCAGAGLDVARGRRLEDVRELRAEQEVLEALGLEAVPDAGTVGDWLRRQGEKGAAALERISRKLIAPCLASAEEVTLDVDATEIEAEKQEAQWTYHHVQGYMPLVGYVDGVCVGHEFREGNESPGAGILEFARHCEGALPAGKHIYLRSDSAAYQAAVINHYSQPGRSFSITDDLDVAVKREIRNLPEAAWQAYRTADGLATDREIAATVHSMNGTE